MSREGRKEIKKWSHTVITENAERRIFDLQNIEDIRPIFMCLVMTF